MHREQKPLFAALSHPNAVLIDFFEFMAKAMNTTVENVKQIPKNFSGNRISGQALAVTGQNNIEFTQLANGQEQFDQDEHGLVAYLRVYSGVNGTLGKTVWVPGVVDPDLLNGTFTLDLNGLVLLRDIPMTIFQQTPEQNLYAGYLQLLSPFAWLAQTKMKITVKTPVNVTAASTNLKFEVSGPAFIS